MQSVKSIQRTYYLVISLFWLATSLPIALFVLLAQARSLDLFQIGIVMDPDLDQHSQLTLRVIIIDDL